MTSGLSPRVLAMVAALPLMFGLASCCPPFCRTPVTNPCPTVITTTNMADDAVVRRIAMSGSAPGTNFEFLYHHRDGTLQSGPTRGVIGSAFKLTLVGQSPSAPPILDPLPLLGGYSVLQYNVPARPCQSRVDWVIHPEVVLPTGYLFLPRQGSGTLRVLIWTFEDPNGMFDLTNAGAVTMAYAEQTLRTALARDEARVWTDDRNNPGPVYVSKRFSGNYVVVPNVQSRLFVAASVEFWIDAGTRACTGCTRPIESLREAGLFTGLSPGAGARDKGLYGPDFVIAPVR